MDKKVFIQKYYCHSVQKVWDCITRAEHIEKWFLPKAEFELKVGEEYLFSAEPMGEWDGKLFGEILEIDEMKKLVYTFNSSMIKYPMKVTWLFEEKDGGTLLTVIHSDFDKISDAPRHYSDIDEGWTRCFTDISKYMNEKYGCL
jgi:uncharacterized protein YndB with AHSA1/START domain